MKELPYEDRLTCACFFMLNSKFPGLGDYDDEITKYLVVGFESGKVELWNMLGQRDMIIS
jgi:hypothetical protein